MVDLSIISLLYFYCCSFGDLSEHTTWLFLVQLCTFCKKENRKHLQMCSFICLQQYTHYLFKLYILVVWSVWLFKCVCQTKRRLFVCSGFKWILSPLLLIFSFFFTKNHFDPIWHIFTHTHTRMCAVKVEKQQLLMHYSLLRTYLLYSSTWLLLLLCGLLFPCQQRHFFRQSNTNRTRKNSYARDFNCS